jgi:hypothetical protein
LLLGNDQLVADQYLLQLPSKTWSEWCEWCIDASLVLFCYLSVTQCRLASILSVLGDLRGQVHILILSECLVGWHYGHAASQRLLQQLMKSQLRL